MTGKLQSLLVATLDNPIVNYQFDWTSIENISNNINAILVVLIILLRMKKTWIILLLFDGDDDFLCSFRHTAKCYRNVQ